MKGQRNTILGSSKCLLAALLSLEVYAFGTLFLWLYYHQLPPKIPIWYSQFYVANRLDTPRNLLIIPVLGLLLIVLNFTIASKLAKRGQELLAFALSAFTFVNISFLNLILARILLLSTPIMVTVPNQSLTILTSFTLAYVIGYLASPPTIRLAKRFSIIDDPAIRRSKHPAIIHTKPTPRAGALAVFIGILFTALYFLPFTKKIWGIFLGATIVLVIGIIDDKYDSLSPYTRLLVQFTAALVVVGAGIGITYFTNPFGGVVMLDQFSIGIFGDNKIIILADLFAVLWIVWTMNMINFSMGVDGQFPGIVGVAAIVIGILSLRLVPYDPNQLNIVLLSFITAGAVFGTMSFNWHPAKMFYGFGNTAIGLILATTAILAGAKVATAVLVLIVPTLDATVSIIRRITKGQSPVKGDRRHLHHRLLDLGWSSPKIATFYMGTTAFFGILSLYASGKMKVLSIVAGAGIVAFLLIVLRLRTPSKRGNHDNTKISSDSITTTSVA